MKMRMIEKSKKILCVDFLWNREKQIAHDTIQCLKNVVHYFNMKIPDILVVIIYLTFFLVHSN